MIDLEKQMLNFDKALRLLGVIYMFVAIIVGLVIQ